MRQFKKIIHHCLLAALVCCSFAACTKLVEVSGPTTSTSSIDIYTTDATAASVLTGIYTKMAQAGLNTSSAQLTNLSLFAGLSADEFGLVGGAALNYQQFYTNALTNITAPNYWRTAYPVIFIANSAIEGLNAATTLTPSVKQQLLGEAKFIRAFHYFYLVNLYGDVPLILGKDYRANSGASRTDKETVYAQIIADLTDAQNQLSPSFLKADALTTTIDRLRPTSWAATALLARVYLYRGEWANAETQATTIINNTATFTLSTLANAFKKAANTTANNEPIWQLQPVNTGWNTEDARVFVLPVGGPSTSYPVFISDTLYKSFESGDARKTAWIGTVPVSGKNYYYPNKYTSATLNAAVTEHSTVLRLAEQFLIRAEARAQLGKLTGTTGSAVADLNMIRTRAGLSAYAGATDKDGLVAAILHERQVELFSEWGHRWFDLKRTGKVDAVMSGITPIKGGTWKSSWQWYPIYLDELNADPNLVQNKDY